MKRKLSHSIYYRNLLSMLIVAVAALMLAGVIFLRQLSAIMMNQQENLWGSQLQRTEESVNSFLAPYQTLPVALGRNSQLRPYQFQKDHKLTYQDVMKELEKYNTSFAGDAILFFHYLSSDVIATQSGTYGKDSFGKKVCIFPEVPYEELWEMIETPFYQILPEGGFCLSESRLEMNAISLIFPVSGESSRPYATLIVVVKSDLLRQILQQAWKEETVILLNNDNEVLLASKPLSEEEQEALDIILTTEDEGINLRHVPDTSFMYMKDSVNMGTSLQYVVLTNQKNVLSSQPIIIAHTVLWLLGILWLLIFIIYCLSRGNYRLVQDILHSVGVDTTHVNHRKYDENQLIRDAVQILNQRSDYLEQQVILNSAYLKEELLRRMLTHRYEDSGEFLQCCSAAGINPVKPYCPIMLLGEQGLSDFKDSENLRALLDRFGYFTMNVGENTVFGLLSESAPGGREELYERLRQQVGELCLCHGDSVDSIDEISDVIMRLCACIPYVTDQHLTGVLSTKDSRMQHCVAQESILINQLQQAVLQNDPLLTEQKIKSIVAYIRDSSTTQHQVRSAWVETVLIMMRELQRLKKPIEEPEKWNPVTTSILDSRREMIEKLEMLAAELVKQMQYALRSDKEIWLENVLTYVNAHYTDADFSIIRISDDFDMSVTAFSNKFKTMMGQTFLSYVSSLKILWAKELLRSTELSLQEISDYLHYSNQSNFGRMFKKLTGMTPNEFREAKGEKK